MARWQPPIPSGAMWSKPARELGPALPLLAYAYDTVRMDGTLEINLRTAAGDLDEPYPTVRRWWTMLRKGPFFADVREHGPSGMVVRFADDWLDWRILRAREVAPVTPAPTHESVSLPIQTDEPKPESDQNRREIGSESVSVLNGAYIGTHVSQEASVAPVAADAAPSPRANGKKPKAERTPRTPRAEPEPTPEVVRRTIAKGSQVDYDNGTSEDKVQVNQAARYLWDHQRLPDETPEALCERIRQAGRWIRQTQHPYKGSQQRMPPAALKKHWQGWLDSLPAPRPVVSAAAEPYNYDAEPSPYAAREARRAARRNGSHP